MFENLLKIARGVIPPNWDEILLEFQAGVLGQSLGKEGECPSTIDRNEALAMAYLCHLAYVGLREGEEVVKNQLSKADVPVGQYRNRPAFSAAPECRSFSICSENDLIFVCRGSANSRDWIINIGIELVKEHTIHEGFDTAAEELWPWVKQTITERARTLGSKLTRVVFTGHSLGGAIAALLAYRLSQSSLAGLRARTEAYTFGCPKFATQTFKCSFPLVAFRAVGDEIPELSLAPKKYRAIGNPYASHGTSYLLADRSRIIVTPDSAHMNLINWGYMIVEVTKRWIDLMESENSHGFDGKTVQFLLQPFPEFCKNYGKILSEIWYGVPSAVILSIVCASISALMGDRLPLSEEEQDSMNKFERALAKSQIIKTVSIVGHRAFAIEYLSKAASNIDEMLTISRKYMDDDIFLRVCTNLVLKKRHQIENYIRYLSKDRVSITA